MVRLTWKSILPRCLKPDQIPYAETKLRVSNQISSRKLSLSDLSNPDSLISISDLCNGNFDLHVFTLKELESVTHNFSRSNYLGEGGFGTVFKGFVSDNLRPGLQAQPVAVKVLDLDGIQGHREWMAEVIILGQLKHQNLVNLIGYCCQDEHRLLVYEYMERGNLETNLFKRYSATLPWLTRLKIAAGAAKGLALLHEAEKPVIYRDFKASNVLLDMDYNAKLSDFGLATDGPEGDESHVTTRIMGTEGYAAPEYIMTGHLTTMSDVFSFGVVLLELLTGKPSVDKNRPSREQNLVKWARPFLKDPHKLDQIMDSRLEGQYSNEGVRKTAELAYQCLSHQAKSRPTMTSVVKTLELLLELNDIPIGPFIYVVPSEADIENTKNKSDDRKIGNRMEEIKEKGCTRHQKGRKNRHQIKLMRSGVVHSDTALCTN